MNPRRPPAFAARLAACLLVHCANAATGAPDATRNGSSDTTIPVGLRAASPASTESAPRVLETRGRVLVRATGEARYRGRAEPGRVLASGEALLTGPEARVELDFGDKGRWRLGEQVIWRLAEASHGDAVLSSGTALVAVPAGRSIRVQGVDATLRLDEGVWLITAVHNDGFKIVALDRGTLGCKLAMAPDPDASPPFAELRLRAGEVVFVPPGGLGFGPIITVFLDEVLATSRLVTGFGTDLPQAERLRQQGSAQRERLRRLSNAFVGGANDASGFDLVVPSPPAPAGPGAVATP